MSTQNRISDYSIFGPRPAGAASTVGAAPAFEGHAPNETVEFQFVVKREPRFLGMWRSLAVLFSRSNFRAGPGSTDFFPSTRIPQFRLAKSSFAASVFFHGSFILMLVCLHNARPLSEPQVAEQEFPPREEIYFRVPLVDPKEALPQPVDEKPPAPPTSPASAKRPGAPADAPPATPKAASTASYGSLTIVSKPSRPDNFHQTIIQPLSPPDLKITTDVKVPNIVLLMGQAAEPAKPGFHLDPSVLKPLQTTRQAPTVEAPTLAPAQPPAPLPVSKTPEITKPAFAMAPSAAKPMQATRQNSPVEAPTVTPAQPAVVMPTSSAPNIARPAFAMAPSGAKPVQAPRPNSSLAAPTVATALGGATVLPVNNTPDIAKPTFAMSPSNTTAVRAVRQTAPVDAPSVGAQPKLALPAIPGPVNSQPQLSIPMVVPSAPSAKKSSDAGQVSSAGGPMLAAPTQSYGLLALGVNPADPGSEVLLPPGNRSGDFSISPASNQPAPGTSSGSKTGAGAATGSRTADSDKALTASAQPAGSDAASRAFEGTLSISGSGAGADGHEMLQALGASMVYPVPADLLPKVRKNQLVVSTGPTGGGGLSVYGAMPCGRVYTVFLQMPVADWTLEYCEQKADASAAPTPQPQSNVIHLETPLAPPDAQARFDFQRIPVPPDKARKLIVLKGVLHEDGSVGQVEIYQGLVPQMDEAARLALSQWKFKPALRDGKPVSVNILVGIPPAAPVPSH
jgi:hypothetical protein